MGMADGARRHDVEQHRPDDLRYPIETLEEDPDLERGMRR